MDDEIREYARAGWSERRIAAALGITRYRVRTTLARFAARTALNGDTWVDAVGLHLDRARYREGDEEQLAFAELAYDLAEWLDENDETSRDAERIGGSLRLVVKGVVEGSDPLVRIHARRAFALRGLPAPSWLAERV